MKLCAREMGVDELGLGLGAKQGKGYNGFTASRGLFNISIQSKFNIFAFEWHLRRGDVVRSGPGKAQLAHAYASFRSNWRTENATSQRTVSVEITSHSLRIKYRTRLIVGKLFEYLLSFGRFVEDACLHVAWEKVDSSIQRIGRTLQDSLCALQIVVCQFVQPSLQPQGVESIYGKDSDAALGTPRTASDVLSATFSRSL
jgi:hypothetical protein